MVAPSVASPSTPAVLSIELMVHHACRLKYSHMVGRITRADLLYGPETCSTRLREQRAITVFQGPTHRTISAISTVDP